MPDLPLVPQFIAAADRTTRRVAGSLITVLSVGQLTGGAYAVFEVCAAPGGGAPLHLHRYQEHGYIVLEGCFAFRVGEETAELAAGSFVFVPRGRLHAYRNAGPAPARLLLLVSPGGIHEQFLAEIGEPVEAGTAAPGAATPLEWARLLSASEKYGLEFAPEASGSSAGAG